MPTVYFPQRSYSYSGIRSPGRVLDTIDRDNTYAVDYELLWQVKAWNGWGGPLEYSNLPWAANNIGIGTYNPVWNPNTDPFPSQDYREQFRKRYRNRSLTWTYTDSVGSSGSSASLTHSGASGGELCPKLTSGNWPTFGNTAGDPPTLTGPPFSLFADILVVGDVASGLTPPTSTTENDDWFSYYLNWNNPGTGYTETVTDSWSTEVPFRAMLSAAKTRIAARTWPGAFTPNLVTNEGFNEFYLAVSASEDYTLYDGSPTTSGIPGPSLYWPNWFPQGLGTASMWLYQAGDGQEQNDGSGSAGRPGDALGDPRGVEAVRCRFRVSKTKPYFIARARIVPQPPGTDATITDVYYERGGIAHANEVIEIGLPTGDTDFVRMNDKFGNPTISWGEVRFAIIDMTPAAWQAASGYTFVH